MISAALNHSTPAGEAADLPPALRELVERATAAPPAGAPTRGPRPGPARPRIGGRTLDPLAPITILPMTAPGGTAVRARFPSPADLAVILVLLAVAVGVLASLGDQRRPWRAAGEACAAAAGPMLSPGRCPAPLPHG